MYLKASLRAGNLDIDWTGKVDGISVLAVRGDPIYAQKHGVYILDEGTREVSNLLFHAPDESMQATKDANGQVPLVAGIVFLSATACETLLNLTLVPPMSACTYLGLDDGATPFKLSLFIDMIQVIAQAKTQSAPRKSASSTMLRAREQAREMMLEAFKSTQVHAIVPDGATFVYMPSSFDAHVQHIYAKSPLRRHASIQEGRPTTTWTNREHSFASGTCHDTSVLVNSVVGANSMVAEEALVCHSQLEDLNWRVEKGAYIFSVRDSYLQSAVPVTLKAGLALQQLRVEFAAGDERGIIDKQLSVWAIFGLEDTIEPNAVVDPNMPHPSPLAKPRASDSGAMGTFCNESWDCFFERTGIEASELWFPGAEQIAGTARLYPIFQNACPAVKADFADIAWMMPGGKPTPTQLQRWRMQWRISHENAIAAASAEREVRWRQHVHAHVGNKVAQFTLRYPELGLDGERTKAMSGLSDSDWALLPFFKMCARQGRGAVALAALDEVAATTKSAGIAARALACIADLLGEMVGRDPIGLRSGPGRNQAFRSAFDALERKDTAAGVALMAVERERWVSTPEALLRAARHYESAAQILIRHATMTALQFISAGTAGAPTKTPADFSKAPWTVAETAARLDIAGGWTDTPPISYEHGGKVTNFAILIDGKRPIGARVKQIEEPKLVLVMGTETLEIKTVDDLCGYTQPQTPGALLKAAFCCAEIVSIDKKETLAEQLKSQYDSGFELHTWSNLPTGSGLGTSSILAGAVLAALWKCTGRTFTDDDLVHAVLHLEQMLTTGGGWQDQVGGLVGGFKVAESPATLPLQVKTTKVLTPDGFADTFSQHLVLIYTGKTRLARNLLQNVIRNWYARDPALVKNADNLVSTAADSVKALETGDLAALGACMSSYWDQKKFMAPGCEPQFVKAMLNAMAPHVHGGSMAGAGGGGFMYVLAKKPNAAVELEAIVRAAVPDIADVKFHDVQVDAVGLHISTTCDDF